MNYFELYNLTVSFKVDKALVKRKYFDLSKKYHPDFVGTGTNAEKEEALEMSSAVNKAYKVFNNEDELIKYVLELKNLLVADEKYELPKDFLMEMMELNEELMDAKFEEDEGKMEKVKSGIRNWESGIKKEVENIISSESIENIDQNQLLQVKDYYFKKKYLNRILDGIK